MKFFLKQVYPLQLLEEFHVCENLDECLSQLNWNSKLAVALSHEHAMNSHLISISQLYCFDEVIYEYALKFLVRRDFAYTKELNKFIQMASAGGLIKQWHKNNKIRSMYKYEQEISLQVTAEKEFGFAIIWLILMTSVILFAFFEQIVYKKARAPNPSRFWMMIDLIIDSDRHFWLENEWN